MRRGEIGDDVVDRALLRLKSCECYEVIRAHFERLGL